MRCNGSNWAVYSPGSWDGFRNDVWAGVIMRLEHHLVGGNVRYISPYIIIIIIICDDWIFWGEKFKIIFKNSNWIMEQEFVLTCCILPLIFLNALHNGVLTRRFMPRTRITACLKKPTKWTREWLKIWDTSWLVNKTLFWL